MYVYLNDHMVRSEDAKVSVFDRGFQYGDGLFETIRVARQRIFFLDEHLARLKSSCQSLNMALPEREWARIISQLLDMNGLGHGLAAVKILVTRGEVQTGLSLERPENPTVVVYARPYTPPDERKYREGITLITFPHRRHHFLARHKSANYLFYLAARDWARGQKADEAVILNADGSVSECATGNIFCRREKRVFVPQSPHYLVGITEAQVKRILKSVGYIIKSQVTTVEDLQTADEVFVTNSLVGILPVNQLDGVHLAHAGELPMILQTRLFETFA